MLAAGEASRFGSPKQRLLLPAVLEVLAKTTLDGIVVVEGAYEVDVLGNRLSQSPPARLVRCADWQRGPGASLRCGLAALSDDTEAAVVVLADGPRLASESVERVVAEWRDGGGDVVAASYGGNRGHPLLVARAAWHDIPDEGLRAREPRLVPCDDLGEPGDVDRPEDLL